MQVLTSTAAKLNLRELPAPSGRLGLPVPGGSQALLATNVQYSGWDDNAKRAIGGPAAHQSGGGLSLPSVPTLIPSTVPAVEESWKDLRTDMDTGA